MPRKIPAQARKFAALLIDSADLLLTFRCPSPRAKLFGRPSFAGGPRTKFSQLREACAGRGEAYSTILCLSAVRVPLVVLRLLRLRGAKVLVNQNGVYYPSWCPEDFAARNAYLRELNNLADHVYFQSRFAEESYRRWVGEPPAKRSVLPNAVDHGFFHPGPGRADLSARVRVVVFLDFRPSTRSLWRYFSALAASATPYDWVFMGTASDASLVDEVRLKTGTASVEWHLSPAPAEVAATLRTCDFALHFVYNDVCPNKVLECLASGVHVICSSSGGTKELVERGGGTVLAVEEGYEREHYPESAVVERVLTGLSPDRVALREAARAASERFDLPRWLEKMASLPGRQNA